MSSRDSLDKFISSYCHCCAGMGCESHDNRKAAKKDLQALITAEIIAELERLKQGHDKPLSAGNAEILLNAIDDRIKYYKAKETQL